MTNSLPLMINYRDIMLIRHANNQASENANRVCATIQLHIFALVFAFITLITHSYRNGANTLTNRYNCHYK